MKLLRCYKIEYTLLLGHLFLYLLLTAYVHVLHSKYLKKNLPDILFILINLLVEIRIFQCRIVSSSSVKWMQQNSPNVD